MKRTFLLSAMFASLLFSTTTHAQIPGVSTVTKALPKVTVGIKLGANLQKVNGGAGYETSLKGGIVGGAFASVRKNKIGVRLEALVKTAKIDVTAAGSSAGHINMIAMDVPLLFEYRLIPRLWLQVGPQFTSLISAKDKNSNDVKTAFNTSDFSGVAGLEVILPVHLTLSARYIYGFTNINNIGSATVNNRGLQIALGFRFL